MQKNMTTKKHMKHNHATNEQHKTNKQCENIQKTLTIMKSNCQKHEQTQNTDEKHMSKL